MNNFGFDFDFVIYDEKIVFNWIWIFFKFLVVKLKKMGKFKNQINNQV